MNESAQQLLPTRKSARNFVTSHLAFHLFDTVGKVDSPRASILLLLHLAKYLGPFL
jgi:hypothetical protein